MFITNVEPGSFNNLAGDVYLELASYLVADDLYALSLTCKQAYIYLRIERRRRYNRFFNAYSITDRKELEWLRWYVGSRRRIPSEKICWLNAYKLRTQLERNVFERRRKLYTTNHDKMGWYSRCRALNPLTSVAVDSDYRKVSVITMEAPSMLDRYRPAVKYTVRPYEKLHNKIFTTVAMRANDHTLVLYDKQYHSSMNFMPLQRGRPFSVHPFENDRENPVMKFHQDARAHTSVMQRTRIGLHNNHALTEVAGPWCIIRLRWPRHRNAVAYRIYDLARRKWCPMYQDGSARNRNHCIVMKYDNNTVVYVRSSIEKENDGCKPQLNLTWWQHSFDQEMPICIHNVNFPVKGICARAWFSMPLWQHPKGFYVFLYQHEFSFNGRFDANREMTSKLLWRAEVKKHFCIRYICKNIDSFIAFHRNQIHIYSLTDGTLKYTVGEGALGNVYNIIGNVMLLKQKRSKFGQVIDMKTGEKKGKYERYFKHWSPVMNAQVISGRSGVNIMDCANIWNNMIVEPSFTPLRRTYAITVTPGIPFS
ncbi:hypothetical protein BDF19DRAFT_429363 [Syncephalis fuscata]|nr:hypothetical protein BDF19DRAFT_429363 [Syncephalis fuscata]